MVNCSIISGEELLVSDYNPSQSFTKTGLGAKYGSTHSDLVMYDTLLLTLGIRHCQLFHTRPRPYRWTQCNFFVLSGPRSIEEVLLCQRQRRRCLTSTLHPIRCHSLESWSAHLFALVKRNIKNIQRFPGPRSSVALLHCTSCRACSGGGNS